MVLHTFDVSKIGPVSAVPLTPEAFASYGGVISADHQIQNVKSLGANYGTAVKIHKVSPIVNNYEKVNTPSTANWNIYRCKAPTHLITHTDGKNEYLLKVLERHPYTTQTFAPMGEQSNEDAYLVIVASSTNGEENLPDPDSLRAFVCKGNQAVTYGAGTWHAPMVVIDESVEHIDFAVMMHESGIADYDCQECYFEPGYKVEYQKKPKL